METRPGAEAGRRAAPLRTIPWRVALCRAARVLIERLLVVNVQDALACSSAHLRTTDWRITPWRAARMTVEELLVGRELDTGGGLIHFGKMYANSLGELNVLGELVHSARVEANLLKEPNAIWELTHLERIETNLP